jgi:hypothetical protein
LIQHKERRKTELLGLNATRGTITSMTCKECGRTFKGVICIACREARARAGILLHQRRFLQTWQLGQIELRLASKTDLVHIQLFDDRWHAYCGAELFGIVPRDRNRELPPAVCSECSRVFHELVARFVPKPS